MFSKKEEEKLQQVAKENGLIYGGLAPEHAVSYNLPDTGTAFRLTPSWTPPDSENPNAVLGALTVVQQMHDELSPDIYAITLPSEEVVRFTGAEAQAEVPAVIHPLPRLVRGAGRKPAISSEQLVLQGETAQICAQVRTRPPRGLVERLAQAVAEWGVPPTAFALERAILVAEGDAALAECAEALKQDPPAYDQCRATILTAPVEMREALPPLRSRPDTATLSGLIWVLEALDGFAWADTGLTEPVSCPEGVYIMSDIEEEGDKVIDVFDQQKITEARAGLSPGVDSDGIPEDPPLYVRLVRGAPPLIGQVSGGAPPDDRSEDFISCFSRHRRDCTYSYYGLNCPY